MHVRVSMEYGRTPSQLFVPAFMTDLLRTDLLLWSNMREVPTDDSDIDTVAYTVFSQGRREGVLTNSHVYSIECLSLAEVPAS